MVFCSLAAAVLCVSCTGVYQHAFTSPSGERAIAYRAGDERQPGGYVMRDREGRELARAPTLMKQEAIRNLGGKPVSHEVLWSPGERTALIFENLSDASPDYQHYLLQEDGSGKWAVSRAGFGFWKNSPKGPAVDPAVEAYRIPEVKQITDDHAVIEWDKKAPVETMPWSEAKLSPISSPGTPGESF